MQRATQIFLNLPGPTQSRQDDELLPLEQVVFTFPARQALSRQLEVHGRWQGGILFGTVSAGVLSVRVAGPLGPPTWHHPLKPQLPYLLGWTDSLYAQFGPSVDWYGNWVAAPDGRLPDERADLTWLHEGARLGLFDARHTLVVLGLSDLTLTGRAYTWDEEEPVLLQCSFNVAAPDPFP